MKPALEKNQISSPRYDSKEKYWPRCGRATSAQRGAIIFHRARAAAAWRRFFPEIREIPEPQSCLYFRVVPETSQWPLKGHSLEKLPPFFIILSEALKSYEINKKTASKNIDFWRSYEFLKMLFFRGAQKRENPCFIKPWSCDVIGGKRS